MHSPGRKKQTPKLKNTDDKLPFTCANVKVWVQKTPDYIGSKGALWNLATYAPDMNFLLLVCNPVDRAWSHYQQVLRVIPQNILKRIFLFHYESYF